ncbi:coiled-coil domain-containing protein 18 [Dendrobates tinctorius]|uniref:coiled-coil domain-containing protein 18 n=1 Tax=Dendrobates tinctorius TaxID=92724 RepID=UPI003CC98E07
MESHASRYTKKQLLGKSLNAASRQLMQTEGTSHDRGHVSRAPLGLTLEDLERPSFCASRESAPKQRNTMLPSGADSLRTAREKTGSMRSMEQENKKLRDQLVTLQEQNAALTSQNHSLRNRMESVQLVLTKCKSKPSSKPSHDVRFYESAFGSRASRIPKLEEQVASLEAESEAQEKALRIAEDKIVESYHKMAEKEEDLQKFREDLKQMKIELYESSKLCKRTEKQRNEALLNAEELTRAFQQYKKNVTEKLEKVKREGSQINLNLQECERERDKLLEKCKNQENELENLREHLRNLTSEKMAEKEKEKSVEMRNLELISLLTQSNQRVLKLESDLENKENVLKDNRTLLQENKELKEQLTKMVKNQCASKPVDIEPVSLLKDGFLDIEHLRNPTSENLKNVDPDDFKLLITELRAELSKKEAENQELSAKFLSAINSHTLDTEPVKLTLQQSEAEKCRHLETVSKQLQEENERLNDTVKELKRKLSKAQADTANAKLSMAQRTRQFQLIQDELLEKASKTTKLEQEMTKKSLKIGSLQKLLDEKTEAYSCAAARNARLEEELMDFKARICHMEENITKEHQEVLLAFEKSKNMHLDQQNELLKQMEHLKCQLEMKNLEVTEQEFTIHSLQEDAASKQQQLESLDNKLMEAKKDFERHRTGAADRMKVLENHLEIEALKVKQLESALAVCKEELGIYLQKLEDNRESFENQTKKRSEEVQCLQKEIKLRSQSLHDTTDENVRLQQTLQQQQHMLQQATTRIGDLEDVQAELEKQVSKLEFELEKQRSSSLVDLKAAEEKLQVANKELSRKTHQVHEFSETVSQVSNELDLCKEKLSQAERQLVTATTDVASKSDKLSQLELMFQRIEIDLSDKTQLVALLQERVTIAESELIRKGELELEWKNNIKHVEELQETLTKTHLSVEEKDLIIQALREELRTCKSGMEERDHELLDMDQALKDRNWELKQRAAQLTQLDMSIREHKVELQQKISQLESSLKKSELETQDHIKQISALDEKLQDARDQLRDKDFELLQKYQHITQLQKENEKKQRAMTEMEQSLREQQKCISEQQQEVKNISQQVMLAQERMQLSHSELIETRQQLTEAQKESDRLTRKLEEKDLRSREELQCCKHDLDDAQHTIGQLKTELEARNEVIKATNEVLILKESELTRLKARISGYERSHALKLMPNPSPLSADLFGDCRTLESCNLPGSSDLNWNLHRSLSDLSLSDDSSIDIKNKMEAGKNLILPNIPLSRITGDRDVRGPSGNFSETSFNPLEYTTDHCDTTSDPPDLGTLSGMLKYIKEEMKLTAVP